ncbi:diadenylate cyclase CdaA [Marinigracilibium pacificum]|uniref:Diadenylate cyclase n=1 Tax=Marinigracilibium pacificum TaxID=2729599 RepID=A0A848J396_9BACT|nr:diadenylate cyclase CdaA [Marinigracilibium pacificum]NMM48819.1 TIGR00159 family protein [Marinigracilibium pacificum]
MNLLFKIGFLNISWIDVIDIFLVAILMYQLYKLMKGSVAVKVFLGFLSLYLIYLVVRASGMELLSSILGEFMGVGVLAVIILFQQEIRKFLLIIGRSTAFNRESFMELLGIKNKKEVISLNVSSVVEAAKTLGGSNTGALIVFSRNSELKFYVESGDMMDAVISKRILLSIFNKYSPLHDGAVIIHNGRIKAARCILPVTEQNLPAQFGLRHRAAIGMSENTDTLVLIISEETGQLSIAKSGKIDHNLSPQEIRKRINEYYRTVEPSLEQMITNSDKEGKKKKKKKPTESLEETS